MKLLNRISILLIIQLFNLYNLQAQAWKLQQAPLMTNFSATIDTNSILPEYPRPQMVRDKWQNLNGVWQFQPGLSGDVVPFNKKLSSSILVPYPVESAISGVMKHYDRLWYRRTFTVPSDWSGKQIILNFGAVDWESEVYINGTSLGIHKGGYDAFSYDITSKLIGSGPQEVIVRVYDPTELYGQPRGKQTTNIIEQNGIMYTPVTGIWQTVWLEPVSSASISNLKLIPDVDGKRLKVSVFTSGSTTGLTVKATAKDGTTIVGSISGNLNSEFYLPIPDVKLWSTTNPFLYDLAITINNGATTMDSVSSYFGMRKISLAYDGAIKIFLNNKIVFQMGPLDQGFWPDGIYTAPSDAALKSDIEQAKSLGFNMLRKHIKVEPQRWYYWADKLGILVWQDMPSVNSYLSTLPLPAIDAPQFKTELEKLIESHWNAPSIIMWILFNEDQGLHDSNTLTQYIQSLDNSRLVNAASGGTKQSFGDIYDMHNYPAPVCPTSISQAAICGEFGGAGFKISGHEWSPAKSHGYGMATDADDLVGRYAAFMTMLNDFKQKNGLCAAIYTELTDVETEINGFLTYDRLPKIDVNRIKAYNNSFIADTVPPTISLQAENAVFIGPVFVKDYAAHGTGYLDIINNSGDYIEWTVKAPSTGNFTLSFRYILLSGNRPVELKINGVVKVASLDFPATGSSTTWGYVTFVVSLNAGNNSIRLTTNGSNGPNMDELVVTAGGLIDAIPSISNPDKIFKLYPMPVSKILNIDGIENTAIITLRNTTGTIVLKTKTTKSIDVNNLPSGVYFLSVNESRPITIIKI